MRLRELRDKMGVSQETVGDYIGVSGTVYSRYETGSREPSIDMTKKLADYFGVSVDFLVENTDFEEATISKSEMELINAFRKADPRARGDAYLLLKSHADDI